MRDNASDDGVRRVRRAVAAASASGDCAKGPQGPPTQNK